MPAQYLESVYTSDISSSDGVARDSKKVAALVRALARNNGTMVSNSTLKQDVAQREGMISTPTLASYLVQLKRIFVLEELGGWAPNIRAKKRARTSPKRYLVDPSLVTAALGASAQRLLSDMPTFGQIFEGLCIRDLLVYSSLFDPQLAQSLIRATSSKSEEWLTNAKEFLSHLRPKVVVSSGMREEVSFDIEWEKVRQDPDAIIDLAETIAKAKSIK